MRNRPSAEILLIRHDGALILQHREDKPNIVRPGMVTTFGGTIEEGEKPIDAGLREINEETNLNLKKSDLIFFKKYKRTLKVDNEKNNLYCFIVKNVDDSKLKLFEGQGIKIAKKLEDLSSFNSAPFLVRIARDYFKGKK